MPRRPALLLLAAAIAGGCDGCPDPIRGADAGHDAAANAPDGAAPSDAGIDARVPLDGSDRDATPDSADTADASEAGATACVGAQPSSASHQEIFGERSAPNGNPFVSRDGLGAAVVWNSGTTPGDVRIARLDANGLRVLPLVSLARLGRVAALTSDGSLLRIAYTDTVAPTSIRLARVSSAGTLDPATVLIGTGALMEGGIAYRPATNEVAVLWTASDASLRVSVVSAAGAVTETMLEPAPTTQINGELLGAVVATDTATAHFVVAYPHVTSVVSNDVMVRPIAPNGSARVVSTAVGAIRQRINASRAIAQDTVLVSWIESSSVHGAIVDAAGASVLAERILVATPAGGTIPRAAAQGAGSTFEIASDVEVGSDRYLELRVFGADGAIIGVPRRIASICALSYSEGQLPFETRPATTRTAAWFDAAIGSVVAATF